MARNIEIKARARDYKAQISVAASLGGNRVQHLAQEDTFFHVPSGRLKRLKQVVFTDDSTEVELFQAW